ncbi:hypothetical protein CR513_03550, partial [Mucuna pruriens]
MDPCRYVGYRPIFPLPLFVHIPEDLPNKPEEEKVRGRKEKGDYTDLNKACPKDPYSLPSIDTLVDGASDYGLLSFMEAYLGCNQIRMHPSDESKTMFIMDEDNFCYKLKQNPKKCSFGIKVGKFLGFMITRRGIEANLEKCNTEEVTGANREWTLSIDGSSNKRGSEEGVILEGPSRVLIEQSLHFGFQASNNQPEYEALLAGIRLTKELRVKMLTVKSDSQLVTR